MNDLFQREGHSIFTFKKGDIIIRVKAAVIKRLDYNDNLGVAVERINYIDQSYRKPVEFIGIYNNMIYLKSLSILPGYIHKANLEDFSENWQLFEIPEGLTLEDCF